MGEDRIITRDLYSNRDPVFAIDMRKNNECGIYYPTFLSIQESKQGLTMVEIRCDIPGNKISTIVGSNDLAKHCLYMNDSQHLIFVKTVSLVVNYYWFRICNSIKYQCLPNGAVTIDNPKGIENPVYSAKYNFNCAYYTKEAKSAGFRYPSMKRFMIEDFETDPTKMCFEDKILDPENPDE